MGQFLTMHTVGALMVGGGSAGGVLLMAWHAARHARRADTAVADRNRYADALAERNAELAALRRQVADHRPAWAKTGGAR